jgi:hypothetical protein
VLERGATDPELNGGVEQLRQRVEHRSAGRRGGGQQVCARDRHGV